MTIASILVLSGFEAIFVVESDDSNTSIGVVLSQNGRPIAYFSKTLAPQTSNSISI